MASKEINTEAFLKRLRWCEHRREDGGVYYTLYGGGRFTDMAAHPKIKVYDKKDKQHKHPHTPAGAYQITSATWDEALRKGIVTDFTQSSQDKIALWLIDQEDALPDVESGNIEHASKKLKGRWSSLPGAKQSHITLAAAKTKFEQYVRELTPSKK